MGDGGVEYVVRVEIQIKSGIPTLRNNSTSKLGLNSVAICDSDIIHCNNRFWKIVIIDFGRL